MDDMEANEGPKRDGCFDCGRPYGNEHGFPDLIIPSSVWRQISPSHDDGGLLCPSCIVKRVAALDVMGTFSIPCAFMSGPLKTIDQETMHCLRWIENLREQGHGWGCPKCGCGREREFGSLTGDPSEPYEVSSSGDGN